MVGFSHSEIPPWPQSRLVITGVCKTPTTVFSCQSSYRSGKECSRALRVRLTIPTLIPHLSQATGAPGQSWAASPLNPLLKDQGLTEILEIIEHIISNFSLTTGEFLQRYLCVGATFKANLYDSEQHM